MADLLSVFISSTIDYQDSLDFFVAYFRKHWSNCKYDIVLATNYDRRPFLNRCQVVNSHNIHDDWITRSLPALRQLHSKYVLVMCDDLFIRSKVDNNRVDAIVEFMNLNDIDYCRIKPCRSHKRINENISFLKKRTPYGFNLQIGIFKVSFLIECLCSALNPWDLERKWLLEASKADRGYFDTAIVSRKSIIHFYHGINKGQWYPSVFNKIKKDFGEIPTSRKVMSKGKEARYKLSSTVGRLMPLRLRAFTKRFLRKVGITFSTDD